jgi:DNA-binding transcriptional ArsR family regulator
MSRHSTEAPDLAAAVPLFVALGDETRLALLARLSAAGPQSIARLTSGSAVTRQAITKHLTILARSGLVHDIRHGRERIWELDTDRLEDARRWLDQIERQWDEALNRLKAFVEQ